MTLHDACRYSLVLTCTSLPRSPVQRECVRLPGGQEPGEDCREDLATLRDKYGSQWEILGLFTGSMVARYGAPGFTATILGTEGGR